MKRKILHVDMDAFFASVEQRECAEYRGKPVIVGADPRSGEGRGVVAACSYEARRFGIHSAQPIRQAFHRCPEGIYLRPNGVLYSQVSASVMRMLSRYTDLVEPISIDEAFLDVTGSQRLFGDAVQIARSIKQDIARLEKLTCSVGIAENKFLAKIASDLCKPDGLLEVPAGEAKAFLSALPIRAVWGVGPRFEERLQRRRVRTIGDVSGRSLKYWRDALGKHGEHLWRLSQGIDERPVIAHEGFKSLSRENTFEKDVIDRRLIERTVLSLSEDVARRARSHQRRAGTVTLKFRYADFKTLTRQKRLQRPSDDPGLIYAAGLELVAEFFPLSQPVRLLGIGLSQFLEKETVQPDLFGSREQQRTRLHRSLDEIAKKFGSGSIRKASLLDDPAQSEDRFSSFLKK